MMTKKEGEEREAEERYRIFRLFLVLLFLLIVVGIAIVGVVLMDVSGKFAKVAAAEPTEVPMAATLPPRKVTPQGEERGEKTPTDGEPLPADQIEETADLFESPVEAKVVFNDESAWLIAEPGVILDETAAWVIPSVKAEHFVNIPEGGFTYFSLGQAVINIDGVSLDLPGAEGLNYLVVIRGRIDDTIVDSDLNTTASVTDFVPGHAIWSIMPPGAYVSKNWFRDQLKVSTTTGGTNCGATGCSTVHVVLFDIDSHFYQMFEVKAGDLDNWKLLESN